MLEVMEEELVPMGAFKILRESIEGCGTKVIPFLALHLSDLTFTEENSDTITNSTGEVLINFSKHQIVNKCITSCLKYQNSTDYSLLTPKEPLFDLLSQLPKISKDDLHMLSLEREPKGALLKDIE